MICATSAVRATCASFVVNLPTESASLTDRHWLLLFVIVRIPDAPARVRAWLLLSLDRLDALERVREGGRLRRVRSRRDLVDVLRRKDTSASVIRERSLERETRADLDPSSRRERQNGSQGVEPCPRRPGRSNEFPQVVRGRVLSVRLAAEERSVDAWRVVGSSSRFDREAERSPLRRDPRSREQFRSHLASILGFCVALFVSRLRSYDRPDCERVALGTASDCVFNFDESCCLVTVAAPLRLDWLSLRRSSCDFS